MKLLLLVALVVLSLSACRREAEEYYDNTANGYSNMPYTENPTDYYVPYTQNPVNNGPEENYDSYYSDGYGDYYNDYYPEYSYDYAPNLQEPIEDPGADEYATEYPTEEYPADDTPYYAENPYENEPTEQTPYQVMLDGVAVAGASLATIGSAMYPTHIKLQPVAEALEISFEWDRQTQQVSLTGQGGDITFAIDAETFYVDGNPITLPYIYHAQDETITTARTPVVINNELYVPELFFRDVFGLGSVYFYYGNMTINTEANDM